MKELKRLENALKNVTPTMSQYDINLLVSCYDSVKFRLKNEFPEVFKELYTDDYDPYHGRDPYGRDRPESDVPPYN